MAEETKEPPANSFFVPGFQDASSYTQDTLRSILIATKTANELPSSGVEFDLCKTYPLFEVVMQKERETILSLMSSLIQNHGIRAKFQGEDAEDDFDLLVDANDAILENVSNYLDEASGLKKSEEELILAVKPSGAINTSWNRKQFNNSSSPQTFKLLTAKNIARPQLSFKDKIDNTNSAFVPIIKEKPNSIKPLAITFENDSGREGYCHPYEWELERFTPKDDMLEAVEAIPPKPLEATALAFIKTEEQLKELCEQLKKEKAFAVDLEHHSYRSFQGITCLMQISTRESDYLIDVLQLRSELHILNEVFTDPKIVKVLHGADWDVMWLQRDFGIYIVNLFDTGQAARVLHFAHLSLAYLLKHYCKVDVDKRFQLADWRIRPLPAEMIKYAREDTHYLLYIYDCLKNDLIAKGNEFKNLLTSTFERSKIICAQRYQKPLFDEEKYMELYKKSRKVFNAKQLYCLKQLYLWRDVMARENDESIAYVLPNHMLLQIAETLPKEQQGILACCNPIPPLVKQQLNELHSIILKVNESSLKQLETLELEQKAQVTKAVSNQIDLSSVVHCPHDIHHLEDRQQHNKSGTSENILPLISKEQAAPVLLKAKPSLSAFFVRNLQSNINKHANQSIPDKVTEILKTLISPYERYKKTEKIQSELQPVRKAAVDDSVEEMDEVRVVDNDDEMTEKMDDGSEVKPNASNLQMTPDSHNMDSIPLRKRSGKRKKKPDIVFIEDTPDSNEPPSKKSWTPEVQTVIPYDYGDTDYKKFLSEKKQKTKTENQRQKSRKFFGKKRKQVKETIYNGAPPSRRNNQQSTKWPKNKGF